MKTTSAGTASVLLASLALSACGASTAPTTKGESGNLGASSPTVRVFDDSEVWRFIGAVHDTRWGPVVAAKDWIIQLPHGATCDVELILHNPTELAVYRGDTIATNSAGWMGIRVTSYEGATATCLQEVGKRLADFK